METIPLWKKHSLRMRTVAGYVCVCVCVLQGSVDDMTQHIYIGTQGNTRSGVYDGYSQSPVVDVSTPQILSCDNTNEFWISWFYNHVQVSSSRQG